MIDNFRQEGVCNAFLLYYPIIPICNITTGTTLGGQVSSPTVTQVYADVMDSDVEEALRNLESSDE